MRNFLPHRVIVFITLFSIFSIGLSANLIINEIAPSGTSLLDEEGKREDWFEIYNNGNEAINLNGIWFTDNPANLQKSQITTDLLIQPGRYLVFFADKDLEQGELHVDFKLKSKGEYLAISKMDGGTLTIIDEINFVRVPLNASYGRTSDGGGDWVLFGEVTPNSSNNGLLFLSPPYFSLDNGIYESAQSVSILHSDTAVTIRYLLGGYLPHETSLAFNSPMEFSNNTTIRAIAYRKGYAPSAPVNGTFLFISDLPNETFPNLDIIALTTDPANFFDDEIGFYTTGTNGTSGFCTEEIANFKHNTREWERPINLKLILKDGSCPVEVNAGAQIAGACSRIYPMRGLNIYLRQKSYGDEEIDYPLFKKREHTKFQRIKLRNSGQDILRTGFKDATIHNALMGKLDMEFLAAKSVLTYLNGEFFGVYNLRELYVGNYFENRFDAEDDLIDVIKSPGMAWENIKIGDSDEYKELKEYIETHDLSIQENFDHVADHLDINNALTYWSSMVYLANTDWPQNNIYIWKNQEGSNKWRYLFQDLDNSTNGKLISSQLTNYPSLGCILNTEPTNGGGSSSNGSGNTMNQCQPESTVIIRGLLKNIDFRNEFIQRTCSFTKLIFDDEFFISEIDSMRNLFEPNFEAQMDKWEDNPEGKNIWGGGWIGSWVDWIDRFKDFFVKRPNIMRKHLKSNFELDASYDLSFTYSDTTHGDIFVNTNEMKIPFSYKGIYFRNIPLRIKAVPHYGYYFKYWLETGDTLAVTDFTGIQDATLTPVFAADIIEDTTAPEARNLTIYPNPSSNLIYFEAGNKEGKMNAAIFNMIGQKVLELSILNKNQISIKSLPKGLYSLVLSSDSSYQIGKFLVE